MGRRVGIGPQAGFGKRIGAARPPIEIDVVGFDGFVAFELGRHGLSLGEGGQGD